MNRVFSVLLLSPSLLFAQSGAHRIGEVFTRGQGVSVNVVPFAKVQVFTPTSGFTVPATVYADAGLTQVKMQPLTADALGNFDYYAGPGCFDEQYSAPGSYQFRQSYVCPGSGGSGGGGGNIGTVTQVNGVGPDPSGHVTIPVGTGTVKSVNGTTPDANGNVALAVAAGTVTSVNGITPVAGNVTVPIVDSAARAAAAASCQQNGSNCPAGGAGNPASPGNSIQLANAGATGFSSAPNVDWTSTGNPNASMGAPTRFYSGPPGFYYDTICPGVDASHVTAYGSMNQQGVITECHSGTSNTILAHMPSLFDFNSMGYANAGGSPLNLGVVASGINLRALNFKTNGPGRNNGTGTGAWFTSAADLKNMVCSALGICELEKNVLETTKYGGDTTMFRQNMNYTPGGNWDPSGEGTTMEYHYFTPLDTYKATANGGYAQGTTQIMTTQTNAGCAAAQASGGDGDKNCSGGGGVLLQTTTSGILARGNVTAYASNVLTLDPSSMVDGNGNAVAFTPGVKATISGGLPDTTNYQAGDAINVTFSNATGTLPANGATGTLCAFGVTGGLMAEAMPYTMTSATTATLTLHRLGQGGSQFGGDAQVYFNACPAIVAVANTAVDGGNRTAIRAVGFPSANTVEFATFRLGQRISPFSPQGSYVVNGSFSNVPSVLANHPNANQLEILRAATVIDTLDRSNLAHDGAMLLGSNDMILNNGDTVEEAYIPANQEAMWNDYGIFRLPSSGIDRAYKNAYLGGDVDRGMDFIGFQSVGSYNNPAIPGSGVRPAMQSIFRMRSVLGNHDGGMYGDFFESPFSPLDSLMRIDGCAPGDNTPDCSGGTATYNIFQGVGHANTDNGTITYNMNQGQLGMHAKTMLLTTQNNGGTTVLGGFKTDTLVANSLSTNQAGSIGTTCSIGGYVTLTIDGNARKIAYCQ